MTILDQIVARKYMEVEERKSLYPPSILEESIFFQKKPESLKKELIREGSFGIIAEFKRKSPSKGNINENALAGEVCLEYIEAGSSAVSVLTDSDFFGGSSSDLTDVRRLVTCPVLRKDFIVDEYQIIEARSVGADAVLLIAELHPAGRLEKLYRFAQSLELEVLIEIHDKKNIPRIPPDADMIGINSRNLASFQVNHDHLLQLIHFLPKNVVKVAESGIKSVIDYVNLKNAGFNAFLIGEYFMSTTNPGRTCKSFIDALRQYHFTPNITDQNIRQ
jgi:indole-3-glycerol phosphate synthase